MGSFLNGFLLVFILSGVFFFVALNDPMISSTAGEGFNIFSGDNNGTLVKGSGVDAAIPVTLESNTVEGAGSAFNFVDALRAPFKMFSIISAFFTAPFDMANSLNVPLLVKIVIFAPIGLLLFIAAMSFLRGTNA